MINSERLETAEGVSRPIKSLKLLTEGKLIA